MKRQTDLNRHDLIAAIGTGGQLILVAPAIDFVFVRLGDSDHTLCVRGDNVCDR